MRGAFQPESHDDEADCMLLRPQENSEAAGGRVGFVYINPQPLRIYKHFIHQQLNSLEQ